MIARAAQVAWVLDYLGDLESDMSAIHRIDDMYAMPGPRFFRLAARIGAYDGAVANRLAMRHLQNQEKAQEISTAAEIAASPLGELVSIAQV
ncbi:hypothetical protein ACRYCC_26305 [Actinomadura scrupuli]|uniref:hypothetical protein n=1 Tax=Actinomadura scrupuli TaxID=559629 RepID=UPI003D98DDF7